MLLLLKSEELHWKKKKTTFEKQKGGEENVWKIKDYFLQAPQKSINCNRIN